jgi:intracellular sulfur oxidation DsrE/DsrF family protein
LSRFFYFFYLPCLCFLFFCIHAFALLQSSLGPCTDRLIFLPVFELVTHFITFLVQTIKMKKLFFITHFIVLISATLHGQPSNSESHAVADSISKAKSKVFRDSLEKAFLSRATYPLIKSSKWSGVIPVANTDKKPDVHQHYKLLMEVTTGMKDSASAKDINEAIAEVGRLMNIHIAAGIPKKNIDVVVVAHGPILKSFYNNAVYKLKYKVDNPNLAVFDELLAAGVKFIACGQAMYFFDVKKEEMLPWMKVALSAQTVLTNYQLKGYVAKKIETDR